MISGLSRRFTSVEIFSISRILSSGPPFPQDFSNRFMIFPMVNFDFSRLFCSVSISLIFSQERAYLIKFLGVSICFLKSVY